MNAQLSVPHRNYHYLYTTYILNRIIVLYGTLFYAYYHKVLSLLRARRIGTRSKVVRIWQELALRPFASLPCPLYRCRSAHLTPSSCCMQQTHLSSGLCVFFFHLSMPFLALSGVAHNFSSSQTVVRGACVLLHFMRNDGSHRTEVCLRQKDSVKWIPSRDKPQADT